MSSEADASRSSSPEPSAPAPAASKAGPSRPAYHASRKATPKVRKPSGKKGKKFIEEKSSLLDLIEQVAGKKDDERAEKLQKFAKVAEVDADAQKQKTQRKLDRTAPLRATKKMLKEKEKLRQRKKKAPAAESKEAAPAEKKRRVAFV